MRENELYFRIFVFYLVRNSIWRSVPVGGRQRSSLTEKINIVFLIVVSSPEKVFGIGSAVKSQNIFKPFRIQSLTYSVKGR